MRCVNQLPVSYLLLYRARFCGRLQAAPVSAWKRRGEGPQRHLPPTPVHSLSILQPLGPPRSPLLERGIVSRCVPQFQVSLGKKPGCPVSSTPRAPHRRPGKRAPGNGPGFRALGGPHTPRLPIFSGSGSTSATWCSSSSAGRGPRTPQPATGSGRARPSSAQLARPALPVPPQLPAVHFASFAFVSWKTTCL